jgi:hypothetical protein
MSADRSAWGGWRRNIKKLKYVNQGYLLGSLKEPAGVRVPIIAMKRLITVEPRGIGKWKRERHTIANQTARSATG